VSNLSDFNPNIYWVVGDKKYYRKVDALLAASESKISTVSFHYYDDIFAKFPWHVEPTETFDELCHQRAQQLRDTNKYLRLWYSGGTDSHTMLHAFVDNNIHLDEIVMVRANPVNAFDSESCAETNLRSIPYIRSLKPLLRKTKISLVNVGTEQYLNYYKNTDWFVETTTYDFGDDPGLILGSRDGITRHTRLKMPEGCVELTGANKAKVFRKAGVYYAPMVDSFVEYPYWASARPFFTTPEFPVLHAKQCHEVKKVVHKHYPNGDLINDLYSPIAMTPEFKKDWYHCCRKVLNYELDYGKGWELLSPKSQIRAKESLEHNPDLFKYYKGSLIELQSKIPKHWETIETGIDGIVGKSYSLGTWNEHR